MTDTAELVVSDVVKRFDPHGPVLDGVGLTARAGSLSVIVGEPESGKSTLVRCLTGVYCPQHGSVRYRVSGSDPVDLTDSDVRTVAWLRAHHIASFDELLTAPPRLPVAVVTARTAGCDRDTALAALARCGVRDLAPVPIGRLRNTERFTVALAAALSADRPFVVLDDPERFAPAEVLRTWIRRSTDRGAAVVLTGGPDSTLAAGATTLGRLREGRIEWL